MIDWNDYRYFLAVATAGSLSAAARRLGVAQPTVGRRIETLEQNLGVRLFERLSHGYLLTPAGETILDRVAELERQTLAIERHIAGADKELAGRVCISTTEGLGFWLATKLPLLQERFPRLEIELTIGMSMLDLLRRETDIALRVGTPGSEELIGRRIGQIGCGLYASSDYLSAHGEPQVLADLAKHRIIESVREIADLAQVKLLRKLAKEASCSLYCNHITVQIAAAQAGIGLVALPVYYLLINASGLQRVLPEAFDLKLDLWLLTYRELRYTTRIRAVLDFLAETVYQDALLLSGQAERQSGE